MGKWVHRLSDINESAETGICANCGPVSLYYNKSHALWVCRQARNAEKRKGWKNQKRPHGLTAEEARVFLQGKRCAICGQEANLVVDHCHTTKAIRGALCHHCNLGLGHFKDSPELLAKAMLYLQT